MLVLLPNYILCNIYLPPPYPTSPIVFVSHINWQSIEIQLRIESREQGEQKIIDLFFLLIPGWKFVNEMRNFKLLIESRVIKNRLTCLILVIFMLMLVSFILCLLYRHLIHFLFSVEQKYFFGCCWGFMW